ncbi:MAG: hypothetical protein O2954_09075 [bacterium]|nr:hypothetical protein [bacterium]
MSEEWKDPGASEGIRATTMQAAILAMVVVNFPMLLVTFGMGYAAQFGWMDVSVGTHVKVGLITAFLTILTHTTTMFYFMGTGSALKEEVKERNLDPQFMAKARAFKGTFFYMLTFGILLAMGTAMVGGGAHADLLRPVQSEGRTMFSILHEVMALATLVVNVIALVQTPVNIRRNNQLLDELGATR